MEEKYALPLRLLKKTAVIDPPVQSSEGETREAGDKQKNAVRNPLVNEALSLFDGKIVDVLYGEDVIQESEGKKRNA